MVQAHAVLAAVGASLFRNATLVLGKYVQQRHLPYLFMVAVASFCISWGAALLMYYQGSYHVERRVVKWVVLRGLTGGGAHVLGLCAVLVGASVGSVGALTSVNTITAALLGYFLLGEAFGRWHLLALLLAVGGVVLIWDPKHIGTSDPRFLGNALALLAGISSGFMTITSRKAREASSLMLAIAATVARCPVALLLAFLPHVKDGRLVNLAVAPQEVALYLLLLMVFLGFFSLLTSAAAKKLPAAVSSTVMVGTQMASGYVFDIICFHKTLDLVTIVGAYIMLLAALAMAFTQPRNTQLEKSTSTEVCANATAENSPSAQVV